MPVKVETVSRWEARLEGDASVPSLSVNSIDADERSVKVKLGTTRTHPHRQVDRPRDRRQRQGQVHRYAMIVLTPVRPLAEDANQAEGSGGPWTGGGTCQSYGMWRWTCNPPPTSLAHRAIATTATMPREARSDAVSELAQAVVLLNRAAARLNSFCGLDSPVKE